MTIGNEYLKFFSVRFVKPNLILPNLTLRRYEYNTYLFFFFFFKPIEG